MIKSRLLTEIKWLGIVIGIIVLFISLPNLAEAYYVGTTIQGISMDSYNGNASLIDESEKFIGNITVIHPEENSIDYLYKTNCENMTIVKNDGYVSFRWDAHHLGGASRNGTYSNFISYSVFIRGGEYLDWTYLGNSLKSSYVGYSPINALNSNDPATIDIGYHYFNTSDQTIIEPQTDYEINVRSNFNISGGLGNYPGVDTGYTSLGASESISVTTLNGFSGDDERDIITPIMIVIVTLVIGILLVLYAYSKYFKRKA